MPDLNRVLGPQHPESLSARLLRLQLQGETGQLPHRVEAMEGLIGEIDPILGPGHQDTLAARSCVAEWLKEDGETDKAEGAYQHVVTMGTEHLGPDHHITLMARSSLTILHYYGTGGEGRSAAVDAMTGVVEGMERAVGPNHPITASTRRLLTQWENARPDPTST
ncbi:tetratricopeptide repeat protein [Streptomyces sp. NBC_01451]|uniref:tetratricopeptide repeat protein n=1 Tax=Streptomyces sp. NBC_01451 TaxID=2903872 RepID=UPI002E2F9C16|nr:tetratricopeptide repeat protein [Streptomyces sp. NBC_01451]